MHKQIKKQQTRQTLTNGNNKTNKHKKHINKTNNKGQPPNPAEANLSKSINLYSPLQTQSARNHPTSEHNLEKTLIIATKASMCQINYT